MTLRQLRYFDAWRVTAISDARRRHVRSRSRRCRCRSGKWRNLGGVLWSEAPAGDADEIRRRDRPARPRDPASVDELGDFARASRDRLAGRLRIGMIPTIAPYLLPKVIENLARMHPELDIHVRETLTPKLIKEVVEGRLDTAIVALPVSEPSLTEVVCFRKTSCWCGPARTRERRCRARDAARDAAAAARRGTLFSRPGAVVLQHARRRRGKCWTRVRCRRSSKWSAPASASP